MPQLGAITAFKLQPSDTAQHGQLQHASDPVQAAYKSSASNTSSSSLSAAGFPPCVAACIACRRFSRATVTERRSSPSVMWCVVPVQAGLKPRTRYIKWLAQPYSSTA
jgi:hypothetical protein